MLRTLGIGILVVSMVAICVYNYCPKHESWHLGHVVDSKYDKYCNNCGAEMNINF